MDIPNEEEWPDVDPDYLDEAWARKQFLGKSFDEAVRFFADNAIHYQESLMYMPCRPFAFYLKAYIAYIMSDAAKGDSDGASCFLSLIRFKAEHDREMIVPLWMEIEPVLKHLAEHQDEFGAKWTIYGSFRTRFHEIVGYGFETSFDTAAPEIAPATVTLRDMAYYSSRPISWAVALQVFRQSGFDAIEAEWREEDIIRIFGPPSLSGGGKHPEFGNIPDWLRYDRPTYTLRFEFEGDAIASVMFMPPIGSSGVPPEVEKFLSPETLERLRWLHAPPTPHPPDGATQPGSFLMALERFDQLFRPD